MMWRSCIVVTLLVATFVARDRVSAPAPVTTAESLSKFPASIDAWTGEDSPLERDVIETAAVDDYLNRYYRTSGSELGLYVGYYQSQRQGEALHSPLFCLPGSGWQPIGTREVALNVSGSPQRSVDALVVERGLDRLLVLYWYQTIGRVTANEYARKLFLIADAFTSGRTDVALVRIIAPIARRDGDGETKALAVARPFAERVLPEIQKRLFRE